MTRLKNIMRLNALSSGGTGLLLIFFSEFIAELFRATRTTPFTGVGIFLLLFAIYVFWQSRKEPPQEKEVRVIIGLDITWVVGSVVLIGAQLFGLSAIGYLIIGAVALWVGTMALLQYKGLASPPHTG